MDHSLGIACIGYGSLRMLRTHRFALAPAQSPARLILAEPDPVAFCVEAMSRDHPEWVERVDQDTRTFIRKRLQREAERAGPMHLH
ncbi:MAG: hypothetical protein IOB85_00810 [Methylobacterium sp.]|nr:hypothetical protein [Methylobacterium sp.]MCA3657559.1 hypothetical protein [Methylobacterium sp.]MCA3660861.1 hypothetical protein [Methylobacterium sp.]MCA3663844.1 hypothetical protein [Methylobacterium sp.]MCA3666839.1 hypothetical protein [Methylobacterium sp.]